MKRQEYKKVERKTRDTGVNKLISRQGLLQERLPVIYERDVGLMSSEYVRK